jgi:hypothetical protein
MQKVFIYDDVKEKWINESDILLFHDLVAVFDDNTNLIYIWKGDKIRKSKLEKGMKGIEDVLSEKEYSKWKLITDEGKFPEGVNQKIDSMLKITKKRKQEEQLKFTHFFTIHLSFIFLLAIVAFAVCSLINLLTPLFNPITNISYQILASEYNLWLKLNQIFTILTLIFLSGNFIISLYERELEMFIFSVIGIIVDIGIILYLRQGIFLFIHQTGSTFSLYLISVPDLISFILLNLTSIGIILGSTSYKLFKFLKTYLKYIFILSKNDTLWKPRNS